MAIRAQKRPGTTGIEELHNATGEIVQWTEGKGEIFVTGEIWQAEGDPNFIFKKGDKVRIIKVTGLHLTVGPLK
jgi:membrane-bound ClpP family serine protease